MDFLLEVQEAVMELTTSWKEEGIQIGLKQGLQQGRLEGIQEGKLEGRLEGKLEGERAVVLRLLTRRFGVLQARDRKRVERLSLEQLDALAVALLDFTSKADLKTWLAECAP